MEEEESSSYSRPWVVSDITEERKQQVNEYEEMKKLDKEWLKKREEEDKIHRLNKMKKEEEEDAMVAWI